MRSITVAIPDDTAARLEELAAKEYRRAKDQAAVMLIDAIDKATASAGSAAMNQLIRDAAARKRR